jgi:low affinity Fe/Cu permease
MDRLFTLVASRTAFAAGQSGAFIVAVSIIAGWGLTGSLFGWSDTWQLLVNTGTTIATVLMVFDAAAMQAKLDELIRAVTDARNEFVGIEHLTDHEIEDIRAVRELAVGENEEGHWRQTSTRHLLERR